MDICACDDAGKQHYCLLVKTPTRAVGGNLIGCVFLVGENTNKGYNLVGENTNKGYSLVGENTNKGCGWELDWRCFSCW
jgi:hypothetical protein